MIKIRLTAFFLLVPFFSIAQNSKSTKDLSFLVGDWEVTRTYYLYPDSPRIYKGTLSCSLSLDEQFISCRYEMQRPGKTRGLDQVYFNYNSIYDSYESVWLSSTWPIKTISKGSLEKIDSQIIFKSFTEFPIENGVMEYVKGELVLKDADMFERNLHLRTSNDPEGEWKHHMKTVAVKKR